MRICERGHHGVASTHGGANGHLDRIRLDRHVTGNIERSRPSHRDHHTVEPAVDELARSLHDLLVRIERATHHGTEFDLVGLDEVRLRLDATNKLVAIGIQVDLCAGLFESGNPDLIGICGGTARKRAREHDDVPAAHLAHKPVEHPSQLLVCDLGTRLVDVGVRLERGILDLEVGARLALDLKHLALDAQLGQHVTQHGAGVTAKKRDGHGFRSQLTHDLRDIDALATGIYAQLADAVHGIEPQILDSCRLVEGGIECDGIDHRTTTFLWRTTMRANMRSYL